MINDILDFLRIPLNIVLLVFGVTIVIQLYYIFRYYLKAARHLPKTKSTKNEAVSVIICAKNEASNIEKNLPLILEQDYENFEVIVVDDGSEDDTPELLHNLKKKYKHLRFTSLIENEKFIHGKKLAVAIGVKAAKNEWLLFTDADCRPSSPQWIKKMAEQFTDTHEILLGYGGYEHKKGLLNHIIRFDTLSIAMQYFGAAINRRPFMGVGRNMAYRKSLFLKNKGFAGHTQILSGDDDLFINQTATKINTGVIIDEDAFTISEPKATFHEWFKQKRRHLSTGKYYKKSNKYFLGFELFWRYLYYGLFVFLIFQYEPWYIVMAMFALRLIAYMTVIKIIMNRLKERDLFLTSPILEIVLPIVYLILSISNNLTGNNNRWK